MQMEMIKDVEMLWNQTVELCLSWHWREWSCVRLSHHMKTCSKCMPSHVCTKCTWFPSHNYYSAHTFRIVTHLRNSYITCGYRGLFMSIIKLTCVLEAALEAFWTQRKWEECCNDFQRSIFFLILLKLTAKVAVAIACSTFSLECKVHGEHQYACDSSLEACCWDDNHSLFFLCFWAGLELSQCCMLNCMYALKMSKPQLKEMVVISQKVSESSND